MTGFIFSIKRISPGVCEQIWCTCQGKMKGIAGNGSTNCKRHVARYLKICDRGRLMCQQLLNYATSKNFKMIICNSILKDLIIVKMSLRTVLIKKRQRHFKGDNC